jgi:hypothetical protein
VVTDAHLYGAVGGVVAFFAVVVVKRIGGQRKVKNEK